MSDETMSTRLRIQAPPEKVFALLADPSTHAFIDGTGWVRGPINGAETITAEGQIFEMAMHHSNHPNGDYTMANKVIAFDPPTTIAWEPGQFDASGNWGSGRWTWRYDVTPAENGCDVVLTYDWSNVPAKLREFIQFPPFPLAHLGNSLRNLDAQVTRGA